MYFIKFTAFVVILMFCLINAMFKACEKGFSHVFHAKFTTQSST